jgi:hypothetical protein
MQDTSFDTQNDAHTGYLQDVYIYKVTFRTQGDSPG